MSGRVRRRVFGFMLVVMGFSLVAMPGQGLAACLPPTPPPVAERPTTPMPPVKSACVDAKPGTAGCLGWEAFSYNDAVKAYNAEIGTFQTAANAYVAKLNAYVKASGDYARCEVDALR